MVLQAKRFVLIFSMIIFSLGNSFNATAQRPPTGGPSPIIDDDPSINPVVFIIGGVVIGAGTYALIKTRGVNLPVAEYLPNYLLAHNILPNEDALDLMYELNPSLRDMSEIRSKKKLNLPDFPKLDQSTIPEELSQPGIDSEISAEQESFDRNKESIENTSIDSPTEDAKLNFEKVKSLVKQVDEQLTSYSSISSLSNTVTKELIYDLMLAFNQSLQEVVTSKQVNSEQLIFMQAIEENLSELIQNIRTITENSRRKISPELNQLLNPESYIASAINESTIKNKPLLDLDRYIDLNNIYLNNTKKFALAVYKYSEDGELITKGPEVEGKYIVSYVAPALKDIERAYHHITNPATYAIGSFPPAKMYLVVDDEMGNRQNLQYPLVDFKLAYETAQQVNEDNLVIVPLNIRP